MNNPKLLQILLFIAMPIGCLFLPGYGGEMSSIPLYESLFTLELLPIYSWIPAMILILLGLFDLHAYIHGKILIRPKLVAGLLIAGMVYQIIDTLIWKFRFYEYPLIGTVSVFILLAYRLFIRTDPRQEV